MLEVVVETLVDASVVPRALLELRSAEAGRAEVSTRTAPAAMVAHPAAAVRMDPRGDVGAGLLMIPPAFGKQLTRRTALAEAGCRVT